MDFCKVSEKLKAILKKEHKLQKVPDAKLASELGLTTVAFSYAKKKNKVPVEKVAQLCAKYKVSINWVLYDQLPEALQEHTESLIRVKYFKHINASAGGGAENDEEMCEYLNIDARIADLLGGIGNLKNIESLKVYGDSMEPLLKDGAIIFIDRTKNDVAKGGIFVLNIGGRLFTKRLRYSAEQKLDLISENTVYPIESVDPHYTDIQILGKVVGSVEGM